MRNIIVMLLLALGATSCVGTQVRDRTLLPAIENAWPGVRADVEYAGNMIEFDLEMWDQAVQSGDFSGLDLKYLQLQAVSGVDLRLADGLIGPQGAVIMRDRARNFVRAVEIYMNSVVARMGVMPTGPLTITRSSWAQHPPSALVERTY